jgi:hypothetical protein
MTFHLLCSSNNIMDNSVHLRLFQRTLTGPSAKWYVDKKSRSNVTFDSLAKTFFTFFQLPICHDNGLELISEFKQTLATHIIDHIHEWLSDIVYAKKKPPNNNASIGFSDHSSLSLPKMWCNIPDIKSMQNKNKMLAMEE